MNRLSGRARPFWSAQFGLERPLSEESHNRVRTLMQRHALPILRADFQGRSGPFEENLVHTQGLTLEVLSSRYYSTETLRRIGADRQLAQTLQNTADQFMRTSSVADPLRIGKLEGWAGRDGHGNLRIGYKVPDIDCKREFYQLAKAFEMHDVWMIEDAIPEIVVVAGSIARRTDAPYAAKVLDRHKPSELLVGAGRFFIDAVACISQ